MARPPTPCTGTETPADRLAAADRRLEWAIAGYGALGCLGEVAIVMGWPTVGALGMLGAAAGLAWAIRAWWRAVGDRRPPRR